MTQEHSGVQRPCFGDKYKPLGTFVFIIGTYFIFSKKEIAKKTGVMEAGGAFLGPTASRMFLQDNGREFKPCWLHREAWGGGGLQNVNFFKKKKRLRMLDRREGKVITPGLLGFSGCLSSSDALIGRPRGSGLAAGCR